MITKSGTKWNSKMLKRFFSLVLLLGLLIAVKPAAAQAAGPIYIVQPGDTLSSIASRFNITINDLMAANNITNPNLLDAGQQLIIPGLEGVTGILDTERINFGDSFLSVARRTQVPIPLLLKLNHLVSPTEFYVGASIIVPKQDNATDLTESFSLDPGESLLELAVQQNTDPWTVMALNNLPGAWSALPNDVLYNKGDTNTQKASGLPSAFVSAQLKTLPLKQGGTAEIIVQPANGVTLSGILVDKPLHFFPLGDGRMVALQGVHAMLDPGLYPLRLDAAFPDGSTQSFEQMILVTSGNYPEDPVLVVSADTIDPAVTDPELNQLIQITTPATQDKLWSGEF